MLDERVHIYTAPWKRTKKKCPECGGPVFMQEFYDCVRFFCKAKGTWRTPKRKLLRNCRWAAQTA